MNSYRIDIDKGRVAECTIVVDGRAPRMFLTHALETRGGSR